MIDKTSDGHVVRMETAVGMIQYVYNMQLLTGGPLNRIVYSLVTCYIDRGETPNIKNWEKKGLPRILNIL